MTLPFSDFINLLFFTSSSPQHCKNKTAAIILFRTSRLLNQIGGNWQDTTNNVSRFSEYIAELTIE